MFNIVRDWAREVMTMPLDKWYGRGAATEIIAAPLSHMIRTEESQGHVIPYGIDGGPTWVRKGHPLEQFMRSGFFGLAPSLVNPQQATASGHEAWFSSVGQTLDGNATWTTLNSTYGPNDLARDPQWEDRLFAANNNGDTNNGGVLISYDGGNPWNVLPLGWTGSIAVVPK